MLNVAMAGVAHAHNRFTLNLIKEREEVHLKYIWDSNNSKAKKYAEEFKTEAVADMKTIWNDDSINAVIILAETHLHLEIVLQALQAGKAIFVEKPLGLSKADSQKMAKAISESELLFQTGYAFRSVPAYAYLHKIIKENALGTITRARASVAHKGVLKGKFDQEYRWMAETEKSGGGGFFDMGLHALDMLIWLLGDIQEVTGSFGSATQRYAGSEEFGEALIKFKSGTVGTVGASWVDQANPVELLISGTEGHAMVRSDDALILKCDKIDGAEGLTPFLNLPKKAPHPLEQFLLTLEGNENYTMISAKEAAYVDEVMGAIFLGAKHKEWIIFKSK